MAQFPPCEEPRAGRQADNVEGLLLPGSTTVYTVRRRGPITTVEGFVPLNPVQVREFYERAPGIQIIVSEDELVESELLFATGKLRNFVKTRASCREGSTIITVIAKQVTALPAPSGAPSAGATTSPSPAP